MAYKVLYRKYRPNAFNKIIGQNSIVYTLKNSIINNNFSHAYMFTGPRGTGKTSTAKVLAKAINCEHPIDGEACNECRSCLNFSTTPDIIEIDAASNNGVDEIRELRNNVTLAPSSSKYKVYIIDEVHMLSPGAFNALLKTLEEPPSHAIFILATTEVYKVPITILSRCQRYDFKKIDKESMISHLKEVCDAENLEYDISAIEEIYSLSEGCLRDALSILDQTSKSTKKLTLEDILENYNIISNKSIEELLLCVKSNDIKKIIDKIEEFENTGMNAQKLIKRIIKYLEKIAIDIKLKSENRFDFKMIKGLIESLNQCYIDARINENVFSMIKISFLDASDAKIITTPDGILQKKQVKVDTKKEQNKEIIKPQKPTDLIDIRINNCFVEVNKDSLSNITNIWQDLDMEKIKTINLKDYKPIAASNKYVILETEEESLAHLFNIKSEEIEKYLSEFETDIKVVAISTTKWIETKEIYKKNLQNKYRYEYIEEPKKEDESTSIKDKMNDMFTEDLIEIA